MQQETSLNDRLLGESPEFLEVLDWVSKIAPLDKPVLVVGERGTGKELIAGIPESFFPVWGNASYVHTNLKTMGSHTNHRGRRP